MNSQEAWDFLETHQHMKPPEITEVLAIPHEVTHKLIVRWALGLRMWFDEVWDEEAHLTS